MNVVVRNGLSLVSSQVATTLIAFVMLLILPNYLGDVDFGRLSFSVIFVGIFYFVGSFGSSTYLTKETARNPELLGPYVYNTIVLKLLVAAGLSAMALALGAVLGFDRQTMLLVGAACAAMALLLVNDVIIACLFGVERMARPAMWGVVHQYVAAALGITAVLLDAGVVVYAFVIVPAALIPAIANLFSLRPELRRARGIDVRVWRVVLAGGVPFVIMGAFQTIYSMADIVMLKPMAGDATVGWYALAYRWINIPVLVAGTAMLALFPSLSVHGIEEDDRFSRLANRALMFVAFVGFPAAAGIALVADDVISMMYGDNFHEAIPLMRILSLSVPIVVIDMVVGMVMMASDRQKPWMIIGAFAAVFNPAVNLFAIPYTVDRYGNGAIGAATATVLTEVAMLVGVVYFLPRGVMDRPTTSYLLRCLAATSTMGVVVLSLGNVSLPMKIGVGALAYAAATVIFRVATRAELEFLRAQLRARSAQPPTSSADSPSPTSTPVE